MGRFLLVTWEAGGNQVPMLGLARRLAQRGHTVAFLGDQTQTARVQATGFPIAVYPQRLGWDGETPARNPEQYARRFFTNLAIARGLEAEIDRDRPDVMVADFFLFAALAGAERAGVAHIALVHTLYESFRWLPDQVLALINEMRSELGLDALAEGEEVWRRPDLTLITALEEIDPGVPHAGSRFRWVGPIFAPPVETLPAAACWPAPDGSPGVLVSFSTMRQDTQAAALQNVLEGLADAPVRVLMTTGPAVDPAALRVPANALVRRFVPHEQVLPEARMVVTHAGHFTTMAALCHGLPLLCMPIAFDQPLLAGIVQGRGAGRTLRLDAGPSEIREAVFDILHNRSYYEAARGLQAQIAGTDGVHTAAVACESLLGQRARESQPQPTTKLEVSG